MNVYRLPIAETMFRYWQMKRDMPWNNEPEPVCDPVVRAILHKEFNRQ